MTMSNANNPQSAQMVQVFGNHDEQTIAQLKRCVAAEPEARGVLCADGHVGYSMPIGGVVAYKNFISPSGVGYDIACGNLAVKTNILETELEPHIDHVADEIARRISFGIGRNNNEPVDNPVFDRIAHSPIKEQRALVQQARNQLGTVGSGNHYVDLLADGDGYIWIAVHFGSRGIGHKTATMFMNVARGLPIDAHAGEGEMHSPALLLDVNQPSGQDYIEAMNIAGAFAYAGREEVVAKVMEILGTSEVRDHVHNHHNFAWKETHANANAEPTDYWVIRKGATPAGPGVRGFVGGSMGDISVILHGRESLTSAQSLYSTVHGAGRVMSRNQAIKGKHAWVCPSLPCGVQFRQPQEKPPKDMKCPVHGLQLRKNQLTDPINFRDVQDTMKSRGIVLRGAGADESPAVYRPLNSVLGAHQDTIQVERILRPRVVVMAGKDVRDPYKD
jgi:tRNA-splicing ligase RtcB